MDSSLLLISIYLLVILIFGYVLFRFLPRLLDGFFDRIPLVNKTLGYFISDSAGILILVTLLIFGIFQLDSNTQLIAILITVASGAFIFTSEGWIQDAFAGAGLQIYSQYEVGDWVTIAGNRGKVERLGLFRTDLRTLDLDIISVRNSQVLGNNIINHSGIPFREIEVIVHTAGYGEYGEDIYRYVADVEEIAKRVQEQVCPEAEVESGLKARAFFLEFGSSSDFVTVVFFAHDRDEAFRDAVSAMHLAMAAELRPKGVVLGQVNANTVENVIEYKAVT